jgi:hypothetical protein
MAGLRDKILLSDRELHPVPPYIVAYRILEEKVIRFRQISQELMREEILADLPVGRSSFSPVQRREYLTTISI